MQSSASTKVSRVLKIKVHLLLEAISEAAVFCGLTRLGSFLRQCIPVEYENQ